MIIWKHRQSAHCPVYFHVPAIHTAIDNPMNAGQTIKASRNFISSEFHPLTWADPSNPKSAFTPILIRITPASCFPPLALNPLPTAPDFPFPALPAVGVGANLDAGVGICVKMTFEWADKLADNEGVVKWESRVAFPEVDVGWDWTDSGFGVMLKSAV